MILACIISYFIIGTAFLAALGMAAKRGDRMQAQLHERQNNQTNKP